MRETRGFVLVAAGGGPSGGIVSISLPDLRRAERTIMTESGWGAHAIAGPDVEGRFVYVENYMTDKRHYLRRSDLAGTSRETLLERKGDALWGHAIGHDLALSPAGDKLAFVGQDEPIHVGVPDQHEVAGRLHYGPLHVLFVETRAIVQTGIKALDRGLSWFPGARRLAYTALLPPSEIPALARRQAIAAGFESWRVIPAVMVLDLDTRASDFLHVGWAPCVSADGETILLSDAMREYRLVSVRTGEARRVRLPGDWAGTAIAFVADDVVLYWGVPTTGTRQEWTIKNSPFVGPKPMGTLKVAELGTGRFKTVLSPVDPRWQVSFGPHRAAGMTGGPPAR